MLLAAAAMSSPAAVAQDSGVGRPILLAPQVESTDRGEEAATRPPFSATGRDSIQGIQVQPLTAPSPDALGVAPGTGAGFGGDIWAGSDRAVVFSLLRQSPADLRSPTLRELARRLLLTRAVPPGPESGAGATDSDGEFLALRVDVLRRLGDLQGLRELLTVVPQRLEGEVVNRARAELAWLDGDRDEACRIVRNALGTYPDSLYWAKALISCQVMAGQDSQATLGLDLLREQTGAQEAAFVRVASAALGLGGVQPTGEALIAEADPFALALLGRSAPDLPDGWAQEAPPLTLQAVAGFADFALADRALAAERLLAMRALEPAKLAALYQSFETTPAELAAALEVSGETDGPRGRAVIYQAAQQDSLPAAQAELLHFALSEIWRDELYAAGAAVLEPQLAGLRPAPDLAWFAGTAGRALFVLGGNERAIGWLRVAEEQAPGDADARAAVIALWPYARLAGAGGGSMGVEDWAAMRWDEGGESPAGRAQLYLTVALAALGDGKRPSWAELAVGDVQVAGSVPAIAPLFGISEAVARGQTGVAILLQLGQMGREPLRQTDALTLGAVLSGLQQLGLDREARALAIEVALAKGY